MKRLIMVAVALLFAVTPIVAAPANAAEPVRTYEFWGVKDYPVVDDGVRYAKLRLALHVAYDDGKPTYVRSYMALHCYRRNSGGSLYAYPCSLSSRLYLIDIVPPVVHRAITDNPANTENTGTDGFFSFYGNWRGDTGGLADNGCGYYSRIRISDLGLYGEHFGPGTYDSWVYDPVGGPTCGIETRSGNDNGGGLPPLVDQK